MLQVETPGGQSLGALLFAKLGRLAAILAIFAAVALPLGFLWFVSQVSDSEVKLTRNADGIVVLTGGASRVNDAFELLASKRGRRLLISGVSPATNQGEISRVLPEYQRLFACCVDLDRTALDTRGNAVGTRRWVQAQNFKSLIVVTSAYHMPRALVEIAHQLPGVELVPYPVISERMRTEPWWHFDTAKLLFSEYVKYILAVLRMRIDPVAEASEWGLRAPGIGS